MPRDLDPTDELAREVKALREAIESIGNPVSAIAEYLTTVVDDMRTLGAEIKDLQIALKKK